MLNGSLYRLEKTVIFSNYVVTCTLFKYSTIQSIFKHILKSANLQLAQFDKIWFDDIHE